MSEERRDHLKFRNDLYLWHMMKLFAKELEILSRFEEINLYQDCIFYGYDNEAFEEYCNCEKINRKGDFHGELECWKCKFYKIEDEENE